MRSRKQVFLSKEEPLLMCVLFILKDNLLAVGSSVSVLSSSASLWLTSALQVNETSILSTVYTMLFLWKLDCNELALYYN